MVYMHNIRKLYIEQKNELHQQWNFSKKFNTHFSSEEK
jgi:hypothetical protein